VICVYEGKSLFPYLFHFEEPDYGILISPVIVFIKFAIIFICSIRQQSINSLHTNQSCITNKFNIINKLNITKLCSSTNKHKVYIILILILKTTRTLKTVKKTYLKLILCILSIVFAFQLQFLILKINHKIKR
jgi:hypothetical protein